MGEAREGGREGGTGRDGGGGRAGRAGEAGQGRELACTGWWDVAAAHSGCLTRKAAPGPGGGDVQKVGWGNRFLR